jgi:hypothetical protein
MGEGDDCMEWRRGIICASVCLAFLILVGPHADAQVLYYNDCSKLPAQALPANSLSSVALSNGGYLYSFNYNKNKQNAHTSCYFGLLDAGFLQENVRIAFTATLIAGEAGMYFGLLFGASDTSFLRKHAVLISGEGHYMIVEPDPDGGSQSRLVENLDSNYIVRGTGVRNSVRIDIRDRTVEFFVNQEKMTTVSTREPARGFLGLYLNQPGISVLYDEIRVERLAK